MILTILAFLGALWLVLAVAFVVFVLVQREERRNEPRYMREARQAAGR